MSQMIVTTYGNTVTTQVFTVLELVLVTFLILFHPATWYSFDREIGRNFVLCLNN